MNFIFRDKPLPSDVEAVRRMAEGTGFFRPDEVDVATELVEETLAKGTASGYYFHFAADADAQAVPSSPTSAVPIMGYVCYGPTPCTVGSFDLYWIVVDRRCQGNGLGLELMRLAEASTKLMGGRQIYVETSGKELYRPTQRFYEKAGYRVAATLPDFYDMGDDKIVYHKIL